MEKLIMDPPGSKDISLRGGGIDIKRCNIALIGISGFGSVHLDVSERLEKKNLLEIKAVCDTNYDASWEKIDELAQRGVKYYKDYSEMLKSEKNLDFVSISTPIHLHRKMAVEAMEKGFNVLLEKPPAVTIQDINDIIETSKKTGKLCAVNFMLTSGKAFKELRKQVEEGRLGRILSITGVGQWKRLDSYYARTPWSGKLLMNNNYVLDGTINNPLAHLLNNMLFAAYSDGASNVSAVTAELYHAHPIDGEDTSCLKAEMDNGIKLFYYATLCTDIKQTPYIIIEGTEGRAVWNYDNELEIESKRQVERNKYDAEDCIENMYRNLCAVISGEEKKVYCNIESTRNFVLTSNGAFESSGKIHAIPSENINRYEQESSILTEVKDINEIIGNAVKAKKLFSEIGIDWAVNGKHFNLTDYKEFKMFKQESQRV